MVVVVVVGSCIGAVIIQVYNSEVFGVVGGWVGCMHHIVGLRTIIQGSLASPRSIRFTLWRGPNLAMLNIPCTSGVGRRRVSKWVYSGYFVRGSHTKLLTLFWNTWNAWNEAHVTLAKVDFLFHCRMDNERAYDT